MRYKTSEKNRFYNFAFFMTYIAFRIYKNDYPVSFINHSVLVVAAPFLLDFCIKLNITSNKYIRSINMHAKGIQSLSTFSKLDNINYNTDRYCEELEQTENICSCEKAFNQFECSKKKDKSFIEANNLSIKSTNIANMAKFLTLFESQENSKFWEYDKLQDIIKPSIPECNAVSQFDQISWKYKNPYSISINSFKHNGKSNTVSENIHKKDEPQEGKTKPYIFSNYQEYLVNYQKTCDAANTKYSFAALIIVMARATAQSLWALLNIIINIAPIIQMFYFILRFILDKIIDIKRTKDLRQIMVKFIILIIQLRTVHVCLIFILSFIVFPIIQMAIYIASKFTVYD